MICGVLCNFTDLLVPNAYAQDKKPVKTTPKTQKKEKKKKVIKVRRNKKGRIVWTNKEREPIDFRADDVIRVTEVTGEIKALSPLAVRWRVIRAGSVVPNGSLVLMEAGSSMKYDFFIRRSSGWFGKQAYVNIVEPTNFRIHTGDLRKISLGEYYLPMIPQNEPTPPELTPEMVGIKAVLDHIWKRVASFVQNDAGGRGYADTLAKKAEIDSSMGLRARKIQMLAPIHGAGIYAFDVPQEIKVIWTPPANSNLDEYKLYVWNTKEIKPRNDYKVIKGNRHSVYLDEDGSYYFQVQSLSGDYVSSPHIAHFFTNKNPSKKVKSKIEDPEEKELHLLSKRPKVADSFVSKTDKAKVEFKWDESDSLRDTDQSLIITKRNDNSTTEFPAKGRSDITLSLPEGDYYWEVVARIVLQEKNKEGELVENMQEFKSERRPFSVYTAKDTADVLSDLFYLYRFQDTTVYMPDGL